MARVIYCILWSAVLFTNSTADFMFFVLVFDATSKLQSGIISGNWYDFGQFDQCISIKESGSTGTIQGKYCIGKISILNDTDVFTKILTVAKNLSVTHEEYNITHAFCVPNSCNPEEVQDLISYITARNVTLSENSCTGGDRPQLSAHAIAAIGVILSMVLLIVLSTVYDKWYKREHEPLPELWEAFSLSKNIDRLLQSSRKRYHITCINGIKVFSMLWINAAHSYLSTMFIPLDNELEVLQWSKSYSGMFVIGASLALDTFFVISGLLTVYTYLRKKRMGFKFNIPLFYLHRLVRLLPALVTVILIHSFVLEFLGYGPLWNVIESFLGDTCRRNWWSTLLFVQNYVNPTEICIPQTWFLSIDMQCFLLSPFLLILLSRWPNASLGAIIALIFVGIIAPLQIGWHMEIPALFGATSSAVVGVDLPNEVLEIKRFRPNSELFLKYYYYPTHTRMAPYLIGMMMGYCMYLVKDNPHKFQMRKILRFAGWTISIGTMLACILGAKVIADTKYSKLQESFYLGFARPAWAVAVSWLIFSCASGQADTLNRFLSMPLYQPICKISYSVFLLHYSIQLMLDATAKSSVHFSNITEIHKSLGDLCITILTSLCFSLIFESPLIALEKLYAGHEKIRSASTISTQTFASGIYPG